MADNLNEDDVRDAIKKSLTAPKKVSTDSGQVEERSISDLEKAHRLLDKLEQDEREKETGRKRPKLGRLGFYGRHNL